MLLPLIISAMKDPAAKLIVADYLEMDCKETPEKSYYVRLLRKGIPSPNDYLSIIDKFGKGSERKLSQRLRKKRFPSEATKRGLRANYLLSYLLNYLENS